MTGFLGGYLPVILLTLQLALATTFILAAIGTGIAWWLARTRSRARNIIAALVSMPLVLPPTVIGFYLLIALGPGGPGGAIASLWGAQTLAFSFVGLVIGSVVYSLPFMVGPVRVAFEAIDAELLETSATLGARPWASFLTIALPLARPGLITGTIMTFAHTIGEFGVVLMIGGNISGETRVLSVAIFDAVERLHWQEAHALSLGMLLFAFALVSAILAIDRNAARLPR